MDDVQSYLNFLFKLSNGESGPSSVDNAPAQRISSHAPSEEEK